MVHYKHSSGDNWSKGRQWFTFEFDVIRIRSAVGGTAQKSTPKSARVLRQASIHLQSEIEQRNRRIVKSFPFPAKCQSEDALAR
jgi:hypothetical protein